MYICILIHHFWHFEWAFSKAQGHWGQWSHLGQGIVPPETWHADNKPLKLLSLTVLPQNHFNLTYKSFFKNADLQNTVLWACNGSEILFPRPCNCAFSAWCSPKFRTFCICTVEKFKRVISYTRLLKHLHTYWQDRQSNAMTDLIEKWLHGGTR